MNDWMGEQLSFAVHFLFVSITTFSLALKWNTKILLHNPLFFFLIYSERKEDFFLYSSYYIKCSTCVYCCITIPEFQTFLMSPFPHYYCAQIPWISGFILSNVSRSHSFGKRLYCSQSPLVSLILVCPCPCLHLTLALVFHYINQITFIITSDYTRTFAHLFVFYWTHDLRHCN